MPNNSTHQIKLIFLASLLGIASFILTQTIINYSRSNDLFSLPTNTTVVATTSILLIYYLVAVIMAGVKDNSQYLWIPIPISFGVFFADIFNLLNYPIAALIVVYIFSAYLVYVGTMYRNLLLKFAPRVALTSCIKGFMWTFALLAGLIYLNMSQTLPPMNIGKTISGYTSGYLENVIETGTRDQLDEQLSNYGLVGYDTDELLQQAGIGTEVGESSGNTGITGFLGIDIGKNVESQVNNYLKPYESFIKPLMATLVFGLFQFYGFIAYLIYLLTIDGIFLAAKHFKLLNVQKVMVEREELYF